MTEVSITLLVFTLLTIVFFTLVVLPIYTIDKVIYSIKGVSIWETICNKLF